MSFTNPICECVCLHIIVVIDICKNKSMENSTYFWRWEYLEFQQNENRKSITTASSLSSILWDSEIINLNQLQHDYNHSIQLKMLPEITKYDTQIIWPTQYSDCQSLKYN